MFHRYGERSLLEHVFQSELNQPRVHRFAADLPERRFGRVQLSWGWGVELRVIECVEELRPELQSCAFTDSAYDRVLHDHRIEVKLAGAKNITETGIS